MSNPFTIRIFVPEGDPDGVRVISRLTSTGTFFAFPRDKWGGLRERLELDHAGIYILHGYSSEDSDLPAVYVGQADTIKTRIDQHQKGKDFWDKAVVFVSPNINTTHAKWLEYALIKRLDEAKRSVVENGNFPQEPTISESEKAEMKVFLNEIYQTLPLVGLQAFEKPKVVSHVESEVIASEKNTIVVPAQEEGFNEVFLGEDSWYAIRIATNMLDKIKYIAAYQVAPVSAVTYYAEVKSIEEYGEDGKYKLTFDGKAKKIETPIIFDFKQGRMQSPRYTSIEKLQKAKKMTELF